MTVTIRGPFQVRMTPAPADPYADGQQMGRMTLDKTYDGALTATGTGQMLTGMGSVKGSAAYVAMERITGTLEGRTGSFLIHHRGTMDRGAQALEIHVVPDSGTGELEGITGRMQIEFEGKQHLYVFAYTLP